MITRCNTFALCFSPTGIINSEGQLWKDQRRFLHEKLRHFGMTVLGNKKHLMESRIMVSVPVARFSPPHLVDRVAIVFDTNQPLFRPPFPHRLRSQNC